MVYEKLDCRRENDTLLLPQKSSESSDEAHNHRHDRPTDMPMVVSFSAAFRGEYGEKYRRYAAQCQLNLLTLGTPLAFPPQYKLLHALITVSGV